VRAVRRLQSSTSSVYCTGKAYIIIVDRARRRQSIAQVRHNRLKVNCIRLTRLTLFAINVIYVQIPTTFHRVYGIMYVRYYESEFLYLLPIFEISFLITYNHQLLQTITSCYRQSPAVTDNHQLLQTITSCHKDVF
jgi:hypothetical protein